MSSKNFISRIFSTTEKIGHALQKHSPEFLTGLGIAGMITTTIVAVKETPKALVLIEDRKQETGKDNLTVKETVKATYKCYILPSITGVTSIACLIGATSIHNKRNAVITAAYTLSESTLKEYQEKVVETIGEKKEKSVQDSVAKEKIEKDPVTNHEVLITGKGKTLCYDTISGRYFECDIDLLKKTEEALNRRLRAEMYISLNDFYYEIGLTSIKLGDELGWNIDKDYIELDFSSQLAEDGRPCLVVDYEVAPKYNYFY